MIVTLREGIVASDELAREMRACEDVAGGFQGARGAGFADDPRSPAGKIQRGKVRAVLGGDAARPDLNTSPWERWFRLNGSSSRSRCRGRTMEAPAGGFAGGGRRPGGRLGAGEAGVAGFVGDVVFAAVSRSSGRSGSCWRGGRWMKSRQVSQT